MLGIQTIIIQDFLSFPLNFTKYVQTFFLGKKIIIINVLLILDLNLTCEVSLVLLSRYNSVQPSAGIYYIILLWYVRAYMECAY